jgi:hypothetical protein
VASIRRRSLTLEHLQTKMMITTALSSKSTEMRAMKLSTIDNTAEATVNKETPKTLEGTNTLQNTPKPRTRTTRKEET